MLQGISDRIDVVIELIYWLLITFLPHIVIHLPDCSVAILVHYYLVVLEKRYAT